MSKPRGQKVPRRHNISGYQLPATSPRHAGLVGYLLKRGTMRTLTIATASAMLMGTCIASSVSFAATEISKDICTNDARQAVAKAQEGLKNDDIGGDRIALTCLVAAVAALETRLQGLADGRMPFEGQIHAPKGVVMTKPSVQEGR